MDYKYILREIKLSKLTGMLMSTEATMFIKFWDELWVDMEVKIDPIKGKIECWKDDHSHYYFVQDDKNDFMWCHYTKVWLFFEKELRLDYYEIQEFIQHMVSEISNQVVNAPRYFRNIHSLSRWARH